MKKIAFLTAVAAGLLLPFLAAADLSMQFDNNGNFTAVAGSSVLVTGTVTNSTQSTVYLNGFYGVPTISGSSTSIGIDLMSTNNYLPASLNAGQNYQGPLVKVVVGTSTLAGVYSGIYNPAGGSAPTSLSPLGPKTFTITVSAAAPTATSSSASTTVPNAPLTAGFSGAQASMTTASTSTSTVASAGGLTIPSGTGSSNGSGSLVSSGQYPAGPRLIKLDGDNTVYWVAPNNLKIPMLSASVFLSYHNKWSDVQAVGQDEFNYYQTAKFIWLNGGGAIYKISVSGTKQQISVQAWAGSGLDAGSIISVNKTDFNSYANGSEITDPADLAN